MTLARLALRLSVDLCPALASSTAYRVCVILSCMHAQLLLTLSYNLDARLLELTTQYIQLPIYAPEMPVPEPAVEVIAVGMPEPAPSGGISFMTESEIDVGVSESQEWVKVEDRAETPVMPTPEPAVEVVAVEVEVEVPAPPMPVPEVSRCTRSSRSPPSDYV